MNFQVRAPSAPMRLSLIGDVARRLGVTPRTLRHYQDQGLIRSYRLARNTRGYDGDAIARLEAIVALRAVGLAIPAIRDILALDEQPSAQIAALRAGLEEALAEQRAQIARAQGLADAIAAAAENDALPPAIAGLRAAPPTAP